MNVNVRLRGSAAEDRVLAYGTIELGGTTPDGTALALAIHEVKLVHAWNGPLLQMPNRVVTDRCPACHAKTPVTSKFCGDCGRRLGSKWRRAPALGRQATPCGVRQDIVLPTDAVTRAYLTAEVVATYGRVRNDPEFLHKELPLP